jgi:hypothetical protein
MSFDARNESGNKLKHLKPSHALASNQTAILVGEPQKDFDNLPPDERNEERPKHWNKMNYKFFKKAIARFTREQDQAAKEMEEVRQHYRHFVLPRCASSKEQQPKKSKFRTTFCVYLPEVSKYEICAVCLCVVSQIHKEDGSSFVQQPYACGAVCLLARLFHRSTQRTGVEVRCLSEQR